jgi:hypothetical protein
MKLIKGIIRFTCLSLALYWGTQSDCYSQGTDLMTRFKQGFYLGIGTGPSKTRINNEGKLTESGLVATDGSSFFGSIDAGYFFSGSFGLSTGLSYSKYSTTLSLGQYANEYDTTDSENQHYKRQISGSSIIELQEIKTISIPFRLNIQIPFGKIVGLYFQTGVSLNFPTSKTYNSTGIFTYKGYYQTYNVTFEDIPYEGFKSNVNNDIAGGLSIKKVIPEFISSGGLQFLLNKKMQFSAGVFYNRFLTDISDYTYDEDFNLSPIEGKVKSIMETSDKATASSMGMVISLRYFIK